MKKFALGLLLLGPAGMAHAQQACERLMAFDTTMVHSNAAARYSVLSLVNQENYEAMKQSAGLSIPGYFSGNYDDFSEKRSRLESMFAASGGFEVEEGFYRHALSPAGAQAYAVCVAQQGNKPIAAWISSKASNSVLAVTVRSGVTGSAIVDYTLDGTNAPLNQPVPLSAGSSQTLLFRRDPGQPFLVVINATNRATQATDSTFVELPPLRLFQTVTEEQAVSGSLMCAAGCQGNTAGCPIHEPTTLVAPSGFSLDRNTLREVGRTVRFGPGSKNLDIQWIENRRDDGSLQSLQGNVRSCEGNSGDTQGATDVAYQVQAVREYLREVTH